MTSEQDRRRSSRDAQAPSETSQVGWSRAGQDAAEAEFPPPREPQDDPKVRMWPVGWFLLAVFVVSVLWGVLCWLSPSGWCWGAMPARRLWGVSSSSIPLGPLEPLGGRLWQLW